MTKLAGRRYWLVGASEGLGRAVARKLAAKGAHLVLSARSAEKLEALASEIDGTVDVLPMDIADDASVAEAFDRLGDIDGLVFLAGVYWPMPADRWDTGHGVAMADVNLTGAMRVLGRVVPAMVARDRGHIVLTGSLSGFRGLPGAIGYSASKAGVMSLAESMYCDLRGSGVQVQLVNPGFIRTRLTEKNDFAMPFIMDPGPAADIFVAHMESGRFKRSFPTLFSWLFRGGQFLPDALYYRMFAPRRS